MRPRSRIPDCAVAVSYTHLDVYKRQDLDGTLLQDDHCTVAEEEINALAEAAERGVVHVIASGRTWDTLQDTARQVKEVRYAILSNGAAWYRPADGTYELIGGIPYPVWEPCSRFLRENGAVFEVYCRGKSLSLIHIYAGFLFRAVFRRP